MSTDWSGCIPRVLVKDNMQEDYMHIDVYHDIA